MGLFTVVFYSCKPEDDETIPAFIRIDTTRTDLDYNSQGSNSHNFTEAWFYVDGQLQGIYEVPALFPALETGTRTITVRPGIKRDGIAATRVDHPHFENWEMTGAEIKSLDTLSIQPTFKLRSGTRVWYEDFEEEGFKLSNTDGADTNLVRITNTNDVFEGTGSGYAFIERPDEVFAVETRENFRFTLGSPVFLELDYKIEGFLSVKLIAHLPNEDISNDVLFILPKRNETGEAEWSKIYVNLSTQIGISVNATSFDVRIIGVPDLNQNNSSYFIDNVKILYF